MLLLKVILLLAFSLILLQDMKERMVHWFLFPVVWFCAGLMFFFKTLSELFLMSLILNFVFVCIMLFIIFLYAKLKLKTKFNNVFGLGDVLFFFAMTCSFSTISFIVIFIGALIFSLALHLIVKKDNQSVPLAGYMSLFFGLTYIGYWTGLINSVYQI